MVTHNKLVRDKIPQIIKDSGRTCSTRILSTEEFNEQLRKKSIEELNEYLSAVDNESAVEELADLLEIIHALALAHGSSIEEVESIRKRKANERGGFQDKVFLIDVND